MSSKLIGGDRAMTAKPLVFRGASGAGMARPEPAQHASGGSGPAPDTDPTALNQQHRIRELEREIESRPRQAYQQGYSEGLAAGAEQAGSRLEPVLAKLAGSIRDLVAVRRRYLQDAEEDAVKLAIAVARKVLHRELTVDPEALLGVVRAAFDRADTRDLHRVRVHPDDAPMLQRHLSAANGPARVEVVADGTLERGAVIVETARGSLDASVTSQLREIEAGLTDLVRRGA